MVTKNEGKEARIKISDSDFKEGTKIHLSHILKKDPSASNKNNVKYTFKIDIVNCTKRNAAYEILDLFSEIGRNHLNNIADKFQSKIAKLLNKVEGILRPNGTQTIVSKIDHKIKSTIFIKQQIENFFEAFIKPDNNDEIKYLTYTGLPDGVRLFKYADQCGKGFSIRADVEILRSIFTQLGCHMDFINKSITNDDQYYHPFVPKGEKFLIVKEVVENWWKDDYFCHELFNGCNPYTIKVANPQTLRPEFH